ncbi:hypothetical protein D3OALGA1CA_542 [Olavius algarvensis associated proteobacterium Delta 3]|nr:hypothetical protein D3OALGA1CA_542 [Olavius algarvensis associated proteobacterium Delta 3]CAB5138825.1 hypothetical protein D3OALGB2SA_4103 [Olavius algarvensis associated proteobacterium Delta 3]
MEQAQIGPLPIHAPVVDFPFKQGTAPALFSDKSQNGTHVSS